MNARDALWLGVCFLALGAVVLASAASCMVERTQPTIIDVPDQARLVAYDTPMYNIVVYGPESEVDESKE